MNRYALFLCVFSVPVAAEIANGHSIPITIDAVDIGANKKKVTVSGGIADTGFAPMIFADGSVEAQLDHINAPGYGNVGLTDIPGFVLEAGIDLHSVINMEIIPRPVLGDPLDERVLFHWSAASQSVALAPNGEALTIVSLPDEIRIPQTTPGPRPIFITHLEPFDVGQHVHFLRYLLDDDPSAAPGAYGFFARFLIAPYENPDPVLIVLKTGLEEASLLAAAKAINAAASDAVGLDGDYNGDGAVDAADYVLWRKGSVVPNTPENYTLWRTNFDMTGGAGTSASIAGAVPEPASLALIILGVLGILGRLRAATFRRH
jgi:hypothetical protein